MQAQNLETIDTFKSLKPRLAKHKKCKKMYKKTWNPTVINFKNFSEQKGFDWLAFGKDGTAYTACSLNRTGEKIQITSDSVGICENNF